MRKTLYTVQRITKDNRFFGPVHAAHDAITTVCDREIDGNWYIVTNAFDGNTTCKKCIKILSDPTKEDIKNVKRSKP